MILGAVLYVYKGEWGLPSIDFDCLRTLCAVKFTRAPIEINTSGNPLWSGVGKLPYLKIGPQKLVGYRKINEFLKSEGFSLNLHLNTKQKHLSTAYDNFVFQNLNAYYFYYMYGNPSNFDTTRALYSKRTPFPFNFYYPGKYFQEAQDVIEVFSDFHIYEKIEDHDTEKILLNAKCCINFLSKKLGNQIWFFGDHYSELDAIVYSYISIIFHVSLPHNPLRDHIKECKNLVVFINRITKDIFRDEGYMTKSNIATSPKTNSGSNLTKSEHEFADNKTKTQILAALGACVAMGTYAAYTGLLKLSFDRDYQQEIPIEEEDEVGSE
ncbi:metaxin-1 homolog [Condylostylus longicornis]|uniref:metaxin-1 homolog n=1 Tax=Condylostylus longicornis TaxID=2530218 RepID=UPI00244DB4A2|nr:metaxin-1 homolog [Condylostylus longicornis]